jgi:hypothetical protein
MGKAIPGTSKDEEFRSRPESFRSPTLSTRSRIPADTVKREVFRLPSR